MDLSIDSTIFIGFLAVTLILGLTSSRGVNTIRGFAVGDRNFSTATIVATIVATWVSGEFFFTNISETYTNGLHFIWIAALGDGLCLLLIGLVFAPRMAEFLGKLSIAEAMGDLFGERVRVITAIAGFIGSAGMIAIQLKIAGLIFEYALGLPSNYGILSAAIIVTLYSALGGIKSVTFTDVIQFFTFAVVIPTVAYVLLTNIDNYDVIGDTLTTNPLFDYKETFDFSNPQAIKHLFLFLWFIVPGFGPAYFQRISMAKNTQQVKKSFVIASITCLILVLIVDWIGILTLATNPFLPGDEIFKHVIFNSSYNIGLKGVMLAGIMAMIMSTVDSYINSTSVLVVHDFCKPLKIKFIKNELFSARIVSLLIGVFSLILSLREGSALEMLTATASFYAPVVTVPFIMAILGFRSSENSVLLSMAAGLVMVIMWDYVLQIKVANSVPCGMIANLITLFGSHYLLKQPGGWVGIKDETALITARQERKRFWNGFFNELKSFSLIKILKNNSPKADGFISIMGLFVMISAFGSVHTMPKEFQEQYAYLLDIIYPITLCSSTALISYPLWLSSWKQSNLRAVVWNAVLFFVLVCFSFLMVLISQFSEIQLIVFMVNIIVISSLTKWKWALVNVFLGVGIVNFCYEYYIAVDGTEASSSSSEFTVIYLLLLISSSLLLFLKPKQEQQELAEEKVEHLNVRIGSQEKQLREALALKGEFIRNVNHEYHAPMTGVISLAQVLSESYDKLSDKQRKEAADAIYKSSIRLESFDANITSLSKLSKAGYELNLEPVDLSALLYDRLEICRKLYENDNEDRDFILKVEEGIIINADKYYITQVLDNLIINAINYCLKGRIIIELERNKTGVVFVIQDEGIGIPTGELLDIFNEFTVSSKTRTPAGGRGVGLALCKRVIEVHGGSIKVESGGVKGARFTVNIQ